MSETYTAKLNAHYGYQGYGQAILDWQKALGRDLDVLTIDDLALADQIHGGGLPSTKALAELAGITAPMRVADLGGALGGPARYLATAYGCSVDVVALASDFCAGGELLTRQMRLQDKVRFF